ncbi:bifunctional glutamate N-acetyltransferase/amino-acid acetyltransferase ArgJ [Tundrisphaera lichenicola]|uniref:bifunctional glutamate N-acetyltransferase/amino-acid acetyltransferase ArgJ n=1 Tax=Tundrisphaera lichenicola TaxID=2029860 RepID=UPI003EB9E0C2
MTDSTSPLSLPQGFRASGVRAGIKPSGGLDMAVLVSDRECSAAGTFTTNRVAAAPVHWDRALLPSDSIRGVVINAGNANAATGQQGLDNAKATASGAAAVLGCRTDQILVASTGVIGHQLPMPRVEAGLRLAIDEANAETSSFHDASHAIMTTDSRPKVVSLQKTIQGKTVTLLGMAKGAAMIGPNMATMLGFLLTDAKVSPDVLHSILKEAVEDSFNCISVEGHMSTNDTVLALANGASEVEDVEALAGMITEACITLARMIPDDGEGATHLITIDVEGARNRDDARAIARAVADSPLVKTAIHGADPNWGRIVSAAGYAGVPFDEPDLSLWLNEVHLYKDGVPLPFDDAATSAHLRANRETHIRLVLNHGDAAIRFWTCDLTAEYIRLNADYTT